SLALVDLYNSTNGPGWYRNTNWLTTNPVSTWYGITVIGTRVKSIFFNQNQLSGSIPSSIGNLGKLDRLSITNCHLRDSIPYSIGNLVNLTTLSLCYNRLSGSIPSSIGNLVNLYKLYLTHNQISGKIPHSFKNLTKIFICDLSFNRLSQNSNIEDSFGMPKPKF